MKEFIYNIRAYIQNMFYVSKYIDITGLYGIICISVMKHIKAYDIKIYVCIYEMQSNFCVISSFDYAIFDKFRHNRRLEWMWLRHA